MSTKVFFRNIPKDWVVFSLDNGCCALNLHEEDDIDTSVYAKVLHPQNEKQLELFLRECENSLTSGDEVINYPSEERTISGYPFTVLSSINTIEGIGDVIKTGYFCVIDENDDGTKLSLITIHTTLMFDNILEDEEHIQQILDDILVGTAT